MKYKWTIEIKQDETGSCTEEEIKCSFARAQSAFFQSLYRDDIEFKITKDTVVLSKPKLPKGTL